MGYPRGLDEYSDMELIEEICLRVVRSDRGQCTYCKRTRGMVPVCRFPERHAVDAPPMFATLMEEIEARFPRE